MARAIIEITGDSKQAQKALQELTGQVNTVGKTLSSILKTATGVAAGFFAFRGVQALFRESVSAGIAWNKQLEISAAKWKVLLGSEQAAQDQLKWMQDFAAKTPFGFEELDEASTRLKAYGFTIEQTRVLMQTLGDTSAAMGRGAAGVDRLGLALGQMQAKTIVATQEMKQLTEMGVPAWKMLADAMGVSVPVLQNMVTKGLVPASKAVPLLVDQMNKAFGGAMQGQMKTFTGLWSTLQKTVRILMGDVFKPLFDWLKDKALPELLDKVQKLREGFAEGGLAGAIKKAFGEDAAAAVASLTKTLRELWNTLSAVFAFIVRNRDVVLPVLEAIALAFVAIRIHAIAAGIATTILNAISMAARALGVTLLVTKAAIDISTLGLTLLVTAGIGLIKNWDTVKRVALNTWGAIKAYVNLCVAGIIEAYAWFIGWFNKAEAERARAEAKRLFDLALAEQGLIDKRNEAAKAAAAEQKRLAKEREDNEARLAAQLNNLALGFGKTETRVWEDTTEAAGEATEKKIDYLEDFEEAFDRTQDRTLTSFKRSQEDATDAFKNELEDRKTEFERGLETAKVEFERHQENLLDSFKRRQDRELDALKKRHDRERTLLDAEYDPKIAALEAEKEAIYTQEEAEEQAKRQLELAKRVAEAEADLAEARLRGDPKRIAEAEETYNEVLADQQEYLTGLQRKAEIDRINDLIAALQAEREERRKALEEEQAEEEKRLQARQERALKAYQRELEDLKIAEQAKWDLAQTIFERSQEGQLKDFEREREDELTRYELRLEDFSDFLAGKLDLQEQYLKDLAALEARITGLDEKSMTPQQVYDEAKRLALAGDMAEAVDLMKRTFFGAITPEGLLKDLNLVRTQGGLPEIPHLAAGGQAWRPGWAMVGERGRELVYLNRGAGVVPLDRGGAGNTIRIDVHGNYIADKLDIREIGRGLVRELMLAGVVMPR